MRSWAGPGLFDPMRKSRISDAELKEEIIKDLTDKKTANKGSRKHLKREMSSQFSNYIERQRMSNQKLGKMTLSSHLSEQSVKNFMEINKLHNKLNQISSNLDEKGVSCVRNLTDSSPMNNHDLLAKKGF